MKKITASDIVLWILRLAIGGVLLYAGFMKAVAPSAEFVAAIDAYRVLPYPVIPWIAIALPYIEMWTGIYVLFGFGLRVSASVAAVLFGIFLCGLGSALVRKIPLASCGCFGAETLKPSQTIGLDIALFICSIILVAASRRARPGTLDALFQRPSGAPASGGAARGRRP